MPEFEELAIGEAPPVEPALEPELPVVPAAPPPPKRPALEEPLPQAAAPVAASLAVAAPRAKPRPRVEQDPPARPPDWRAVSDLARCP